MPRLYVLVKMVKMYRAVCTVLFAQLLGCQNASSLKKHHAEIVKFPRKKQLY